MTDPVLEIESISFSYPAADPTGQPILALREASLRLFPGEAVGLIGQNGSGKSTLARHVNGLLRPDEGVVRLLGVDIREAEPGELIDRAGYVFQNPDHALFLPTIREELEYGLRHLQLSPDERQERLQRTLTAFGLAGLEDRHPASFGRGMRRMIVIAAAVALAPRLLVLDEPTAGLDLAMTQRLIAVLAELVGRGIAILLITHDMRLAAEFCDRVVVLHAGRVLGDGMPAEIFHDANLMAAAGLRPPVSARLASDLRDRGVPEDIVTVDGLVDAIGKRWRDT